ncbi:hypothetical protein [Calothrix sp. 336/3]|uniref:hypothetical protein n=1 Tax=Calothrix sp. 336/3 TaxID=1337936 RepID=UPI0004E43C66|nr:hypothetical protein [Calothrix sp. 336/3]AKG22536.1 hypothetical protein IJ00_15775 [Calothrix sp. 336/3]
MKKIFDISLRELIIDTTANISDKYLVQLLLATFDRYNYHLEIAKNNHKFFRNSNYFFSFLIPVYSAFFTYIVSNDLIISKTILGVLGLILTIMTIVVSILKPYERCIAAAEVLIVLSDWKTDLIVNLGNVELEVDTNHKRQALYELLQRKDKEISQVGEAMMENLIPKCINVQGKTDKDKS